MALHAGGWLAQGAIAVLERGADEGGLALPWFATLDERRYGAARVLFLSPAL
jgi:16S rRNA (guanine966-N2)-methyltransferase